MPSGCHVGFLGLRCVQVQGCPGESPQIYNCISVTVTECDPHVRVTISRDRKPGQLLDCGTVTPIPATRLTTRTRDICPSLTKVSRESEEYILGKLSMAPLFPQCYKSQYKFVNPYQDRGCVMVPHHMALKVNISDISKFLSLLQNCKMPNPDPHLMILASD